MKVFYFTTELAPGSTVIEVVYQESPPEVRPSDDQVLMKAYGSDAEDAKSNLAAIAKDHGEAIVAEAEARVDGTKLAIRELTT